MRLLAIISVVLISLTASPQVVKKMPYQFDGSVTINDTLKIGSSSNLQDYGKYLKVDTLSNGSYYFVADTVSSSSTTLPYDSITDRPFTTTVGGFIQTDTSKVLSLGGASDTTIASLYTKRGIRHCVYQMTRWGGCS